MVKLVFVSVYLPRIHHSVLRVLHCALLRGR